jgi:23S rRNA (cytidine2498-2'-O)-methyltransferase
MPADFLFAVCQPGAESALKIDVARTQPELRFAFSRPGFVTFRAGTSSAAPGVVDSAFARTSGHSLGKVVGVDDAALARAAWEAIATGLPAETFAAARHLHVWPRDRPLPGDDGFAPALLAPAQAAAEALHAARPVDRTPRELAVNETARDGDVVLDCTLVTPGEWWLGWHAVERVEQRWPGGVPPLVAPRRLISRAYLKISEALLWSQLPVEAGDSCVEIGSAPGGACLALLERGCLVTGIDPAEMDPLVLAQPGFTHVRSRAKDAKHAVFRACRWLVMDANVAPKYTLDTVTAILARPQVRPEGLILTLKLTDPKLAAKLPDFAVRLARCGYGRIRMHQLAFNRQEVCVVASEPVPRLQRTPRTL